MRRWRGRCPTSPGLHASRAPDAGRGCASFPARAKRRARRSRGVKVVKTSEPARPPEAPAARAAAPAAVSASERSAASRLSRFALVGLLLAALAWGGDWIWRWWTVERFVVSTDDAYVRADVATIASKIAGYVAAIDVRNGDIVRAGGVIARLEDGDYALAVEAARNRIASQHATIARLQRQAESARAAAEQARAEIAGARAAAELARAEHGRYAALAARDFASRSRFEQAEAERARAASALTASEAALVTARSRIDVAEAETAEAERLLVELATALARAERDRGFATIRAPFDGVIGNKAVQAGEYVQPGARVAALVPLGQVYVEANFKETHFARLKPGQRVRIAVDAMPDRPLEGRVVAFSPASGAVFSLLPPENATGNFTKIVQRVPVRVSVPADAAAAGLLRPGLSVVVRIDTRDPGGE
jgi:membrane fusion protein (multidrug efflux system)